MFKQVSKKKGLEWINLQRLAINQSMGQAMTKAKCHEHAPQMICESCVVVCSHVETGKTHHGGCYAMYLLLGNSHIWLCGWFVKRFTDFPPSPEVASMQASTGPNSAVRAGTGWDDHQHHKPIVGRGEVNTNNRINRRRIYKGRTTMCI